MSTIDLAPDLLAGQSQRYAGIVHRLEGARDELLGTLQQCEGALGGQVQDVMADLRASVAHGLDVLVHDHRQVQVGLAAVAATFEQLDRGLFR